MTAPSACETPNGRHATSTEPVRCLLCGGRTALVGLFEPGEPWRFWAQAPESGRLRAIVYGLCRAHDGAGAPAAVEAELERRMAGRDGR